MNIIMIMSDSFRQDHLGCYGNSWIETPNLDKLASESVLFENAYCEGLPTLPVRTALFTGNYTLTNRFWQQLTPQDVSMAEILDEYNYLCAMVTDTYHMFKPNMNFHRGFHVWRFIRGQECDVYRSGPHGKNLNDYIKPEMLGTRYIRNLDQYLRNIRDREKEEDYFVAKVMREAVQWIENDRETGRPFFLYVDCFDPHEPWDPPEPFASKYTDPGYKGPKIIQPKFGPSDWMTEEELKNTRALYAGEVSFVDKWIGYLLDDIKNRGLMDESLIIFLSDHGHPHGDHGKILKATDQLYSELLRIPLMIRFPEAKNAGKRINCIVSVVDILPTVFDILGYRREIELMQGKSMLPLITGKTEKIHDYVTMGFFDSEDRCIRDERWSYIRRPEGRRCELYDLIEDPKESKNLIDQYPEKAKEMDDAIAKIYACRLQKEHWAQLRYDVPGMCEKQFPPVRLWKK
ncbi:MAG: sulfatase [Deltaproteobacteria bacterium]|nr:sulfatase [Deltaproteobacteria bacterium]MBW2154658.1 sulfatase [Deltaproteobacteria bacterium]